MHGVHAGRSSALTHKGGTTIMIDRPKAWFINQSFANALARGGKPAAGTARARARERAAAAAAADVADVADVAAAARSEGERATIE